MGGVSGARRDWGPWTELKLDSLSEYLHGFTQASQRAKGTLYLDLFAGSATNASREDGHDIMGSARRALQTEPEFTKLAFFEMQSSAAESLRAELFERHGERDFCVIEGDCNDEVPNFLAGLERGWRQAPSFAFIDQYAAEIRWSTLQSLAEFREPNWQGKHRKMEQWLLFSDSSIPRAAGVSAGFADRLDHMFGTQHWREIFDARRADVLTGAEARLEYVNLMRWRLQVDLDYKVTLPFQLKIPQGQGLYWMIFATDDEAGTRIMDYLIEKAHQQQERAQAALKAHRKLQRLQEHDTDVGGALFAADATMMAQAPIRARDPLLPPRQPYGLAEGQAVAPFGI